ncbi:hypothetical protein KI387_017414 [Taxus chinensis]|uniref:K Homology domain-containing protein n=1 Tax=Taxus chinensis TaxID=29808 RepID=A0AA38LHI7_TAXCH|nr:hypothetical protein KI387_017414 [Taxus chinensis]
MADYEHQVGDKRKIDCPQETPSTGFSAPVISQSVALMAKAKAQEMVDRLLMGKRARVDQEVDGNGGQNIKYLQQQSGCARIQVVQDHGSADPYCMTKQVELTGSSEQIDRAQQLINDVIAQADAGGGLALLYRQVWQGRSKCR